MKKFPKKYNYKNINNIKFPNKNNKTKTIEAYSTLFPSDQKIHPGCVFSLFFQDLMSKISYIKGNTINLNIGFGTSSSFYSKLNDKDINKINLEMHSQKQTKQNIKFFEKLGLGCEFTQDSFVASEQFNRYLRKVFVDLYQNEKLLYQKDIAYRSKSLQTNLFKNNIEIKEQDVTEYTIKYFVDSKGHALTVQTTSLETIFADIAIAVNPQDKRYKKLIGKDVIIPIINKVIPIIGDESIDSFKGSGVARITPGHNQFGLDIANKHNLPTDVFAIDINGNFTKHAGEFSGKKVSDFFENIVKYIDDIGNLDSKKTVKKYKNFNLHTGELLDNLVLNQRSIKYSYSLDYLSQEISGDSFKVIQPNQKTQLLSILDQKQTVNISNKSAKGILIPIIIADKGDVFPISDDVIIERYKSSNTKRNLILTIIIINLILDNHLSVSFTIEELIDVLFSHDSSGQATKIERYIEIYTQESLHTKQYKKGLKDLQRLLGKIDKDSEKVQLLLELLKDSFAIKFDDDKILLDFASLFAKRDILRLQTQDGFNKSFVDSVRYLYKNNLTHSVDSYESIEKIGGPLFACEDQKDYALNTLLLALEYSKKLMFTSLNFHPSLVDIKGRKIVNSNSKFLIKDFRENIDAYGADVMRLIMLLAKHKNPTNNKIKSENNLTEGLIFDTYKVQEYSHLLNKIRNASRYVYSKHIVANNNKIKIKDLINKIESNTTDYDLWIIHSIKTILDDYEYQLSENNTLELGNKILSFCKNTLCDKYLESTKINQDDNTSSVTILSFALVLRLIKPYIPSFVQEIESIFDIDWGDYNLFNFRDFTPKEKNYKINLLMDMVDKLQKLKLEVGAKKHETIDIFIQANPEFLDFISESHELLNSLVNISNIDYIRLHENAPIGYKTDNVININLGVRAVAQENIKKDVLFEIEEDRLEKLEHLQHLKSLVASVSQTGNESIINQKRKEITLLQKEVEDLDFEISKLKAR